MISQHWFRQLLGAVRQQAITWAKADSDLCGYMVSLVQNELIGVIASVLQGIHKKIFEFCNISWIRTEYENKTLNQLD